MVHLDFSTLRSFIDLFSKSFMQLGYSIKSSTLERLAIFVHRHMDGQQRLYHGLHHVIELAEGCGPIPTLASLYHDIVQINIDKGYSPHIKKKIDTFVSFDSKQRMVKEVNPKKHLAVQITLDIFDIKPGEIIENSQKESEFLSALVAVAELNSILSPKELLKVAACIEATIPFRIESAESLSAIDSLAKRIHEINLKYNLTMSEAEIDQCLKDAITVANRDVLNFAEKDVGYFIFNTWSLLPETNILMRYLKTIEAKTFCKSIFGSIKFMSLIKPEVIFHQYKNEPDNKTYQLLLDNCTKNLTSTNVYFRTVYHACALIEAFSQLTGDSAPLSMFIGDLPALGKKCPLQNHIFPIAKPQATANLEIYNLFANGREERDKYRLAAFPAAAFTYSSLGEKFILETASKAHDFLEGKLSANGFLKLHSQDFLTLYWNSLTIMATTRKNLLNLNQLNAA